MKIWLLFQSATRPPTAIPAALIVKRHRARSGLFIRLLGDARNPHACRLPFAIDAKQHPSNLGTAEVEAIAV